MSEFAMTGVTPEVSLAGALLVDARALTEIRTCCCSDDFQYSDTRALFDAACTMADAGDPIDAATLSDRARLDQARAAEWMNVTPSAAHAVEYAKLVHENSQKRRLKEAIESAQDAMDNGSSAFEAGMRLQECAAGITGAQAGTVHISYACFDLCEEREKMNDGTLKVHVPTGIPGLDKVFSGGMRKGGLYILAARPGNCKTTTALNIARSAARKGVHTLFISLEMSQEDLTAKLASIEASGLPTGAITGAAPVSDAHMKRLYDACNALSNLPLDLRCRPSTLADIESAALNTKAELVIVDYLGLITAGSRTGRSSLYELTTAHSRGLKQMALRLNIPILCLCQLNREVENRDNKKPRLCDLRDSGAIEQDADAVILQNKLDTDELDIVRSLELSVQKNRHGCLGDMWLCWNPGNSRVYEDAGWQPRLSK